MASLNEFPPLTGHHGRRLFRAMAAIVLCLGTAGVLRVNAVEVWDGPLATFAVPAFSDWTVPANQDRITTNVWIARGTTQGIFNAATEGGYTHFSSPAGTLWAYGNLSDYASLTYSVWETWNGRNPPSMVGQDAVLHLVDNDIYLSIHFTSWGGPGGGFAYERSTPSVPEPSRAQMVSVGLVILIGTQVCRRIMRGR